MKQGYLSQYFEGVAAKRLTAVETDPKVSNQHEYNGVQGLKGLLGTNNSGDTIRFPTRYIWLAEENETIMADGMLSWYDSRFAQANRSAEWRLVYQGNDVMSQAKAGDLLFLAKRSNGTILNIIATAGSTVENQLLWLFNAPVQEGRDFFIHDFEGEDKEVDFAARLILDELGIDIEEPEAEKLDELLERFKGEFPKTREFSLFARRTIEADPIGDPDGTVLAWMEQEEKLFRRLERQIVDRRLQNGFMREDGADVDGFIGFSLSVQNRRKVRAGLALENHLEAIFNMHDVSYSRVSPTENKSKPDFLFPSGVYQSSDFPAELLTMLGVKTSCKDRWRQVLSEAARIPEKHLLTLEPGISENQTDEMRANNLQLVLPKGIHETYNPKQKDWLMSFTQFLELTKDKQSRAHGKF